MGRSYAVLKTFLAPRQFPEEKLVESEDTEQDCEVEAMPVNESDVPSKETAPVYARPSVESNQGKRAFTHSFDDA